MKTVLNCDDTFERLTAGPLDDTDDAKQAISEHLRECDSCRRIADALRPALHLVREALPRTQRDGLPTFLPEDDEQTLSIMQKVRVASRAETAASKNFGFRNTVSLWWIAAVAASVLAISWFQTIAVEAPAAQVAPSLAAMDLPPACFPKDGSLDEMQSATSELSFECCTQCHTSSSDLRIPKIGIQRVLLACQQCHVDM